MPRSRLPAHVAALATELAELPGTLAVVLGGSRASATHRPDSDWDLGVYYRGSQRPLDPGDGDLRVAVTPPGGRAVVTKVAVVLRDR